MDNDRDSLGCRQRMKLLSGERPNRGLSWWVWMMKQPVYAWVAFVAGWPCLVLCIGLGFLMLTAIVGCVTSLSNVKEIGDLVDIEYKNYMDGDIESARLQDAVDWAIKDNEKQRQDTYSPSPCSSAPYIPTPAPPPPIQACSASSGFTDAADRRRSGRNCAGFLTNGYCHQAHAGPTRRRSWGAEAADTCRKTCGLCWQTTTTTTTTITVLPSITCSFENAGICSWVTVGSQKWRRRSGGTPSTGTGPGRAQDGRYYMYIEASSPNYPSKEFILESPSLGPRSSDHKLSFYYHMFGGNGDQMGTLSLNVLGLGSASSSLWNASGNAGNTWHFAEVTVPQSSTKVQFKGTTGSKWNSDMAIDNVRFDVSQAQQTSGGRRLSVLDDEPTPISFRKLQPSSSSSNSSSPSNVRTGAFQELTVFYHAKDTVKTLATAESLDEIKKFEQSVKDFAGFDRCRSPNVNSRHSFQGKTNNGKKYDYERCLPVSSLTNLFYPSKQMASAPPGHRRRRSRNGWAEIFYDGMGPLTDDIDAVLLDLRRADARWWVDKQFSNASAAVKTARAVFRTFDGKDWLKDLYKKVLLEANDGKYKNIQIVWQGPQWLQDEELFDTLMHDIKWSALSFGSVGVYFLFQMRSFTLAFAAVLGMSLSFASAFFFYRYVMDFAKMTLPNFVALFMITGIAADDVLVLFNSFRQARVSKDFGANPAPRERMLLAYTSAGKAMLATTFSTCCSFYALCFSSLYILRSLGAFMGTVVLLNYFSVMTIFCGTLLLTELYCCCGKRERDRTAPTSRCLCVRNALSPRADRAKRQLSRTLALNEVGMGEQLISDYLIPSIVLPRHLLPPIMTMLCLILTIVAFFSVELRFGTPQVTKKSQNLGMLVQMTEETFKSYDGIDRAISELYYPMVKDACPGSDSCVYPYCPSLNCSWRGTCNMRDKANPTCDCYSGFTGGNCESNTASSVGSNAGAWSYDCAYSHDWEEGWSTKKKEYCCFKGFLPSCYQPDKTCCNCATGPSPSPPPVGVNPSPGGPNPPPSPSPTPSPPSPSPSPPSGSTTPAPNALGVLHSAGHVVEVMFVWGIKGFRLDGGTKKPEYDSSFAFDQTFLNFSQYALQQARLEPKLKVRPDQKSWLEDWTWNKGTQDRSANDIGIPGPQLYDWRNAYCAYYVIARLKMNVLKQDGGQALDLKKKWEAWGSTLNSQAPPGNRFLLISATWTQLETEQEIISSTAFAIGMSVVLVFVVTGVFQGNWILSVLTVFAVVLSVLLLFAIIILVLGWKFNFTVAIGITISFGLSVDYVMHLSHKYHASREVAPLYKTAEALLQVTGPILGSSFTTIVSALFVLPCWFWSYFQLGVMLAINATLAVICTFLFMAPLLMVGGPTGATGSMTGVLRALLPKATWKWIGVWTCQDDILDRMDESGWDEDHEFDFVDANYFRHMSDDDLRNGFLTWEQLHAQDVKVLQRKHVHARECVRGAHRGKRLAVSHRWICEKDPDPNGSKLRVLQEFLVDNPQFEEVWIDYCCLPQRREYSKINDGFFTECLAWMNLIFLVSDVLVIADAQYLGRFWTNFEAYLSMRVITKKGLAEEKGQPRFHLVVTGVDASSSKAEIDSSLKRRWAACTIEDARHKLESDDIDVREKTDKTIQLQKLDELYIQCDKIAQLADAPDEQSRDRDDLLVEIEDNAIESEPLKTSMSRPSLG